MNKWIYIALCWLSFVAYGQEDDQLYDHGLDQSKWKDIRDGIRYEGQKKGAGREWTYESKEEYERARKESGDSGSGSGGGSGNGSGWGSGDGASERSTESTYEPPPDTDVNFESPDFGGMGFLGWIFIIAFCVGLAILIYYLFVNGERKGKKITAKELDFETVNPTEIPLTELERLLQEALAEKDYRGAIRIYFIFIIRDLSEKNWIRWEKEKTNMHYLREMSGKNEFEDFNTSVSYFEIIWYGKREIDAEKFEAIRPKFTRLLDKLGVK